MIFFTAMENGTEEIGVHRSDRDERANPKIRNIWQHNTHCNM